MIYFFGGSPSHFLQVAEEGSMNQAHSSNLRANIEIRCPTCKQKSHLFLEMSHLVAVFGNM